MNLSSRYNVLSILKGTKKDRRVERYKIHQFTMSQKADQEKENRAGEEEKTNETKCGSDVRFKDYKGQIV